ncbi:MAG: hypothetical protein AAFS07_16145 [Pseudomonadota bacterium]
MTAASQKLDDVDWHIESAESAHPDLDPADEVTHPEILGHAGAHIALFARWGLSRGTGPMIEEWGVGEAAAKVAAGEMSGSTFMDQEADWKLFSGLFDEETRAFANAYYGGMSGLYPWDVNRAVDGDFTWREADCDFADFSQLVDRRLAEFRAGGAAAVRRAGALKRLFGAAGPQPACWGPHT